MNQAAARFCDRPFGAHEQRYVAAVPCPELDQNLSQFFEVAIGQIGHHPRESGERSELADITEADVGDERIFVRPDVEGLDDKAGAFELKRYMSAASGGLKHPALDRHGAE